MKSKTELIFYLELAIGLALLAGVAVYAVVAIPFVFQVEQDIVPRTISALPRVRKISGQKAIENIQQLHGYDFKLKNSTFAVYGNQNVILWVSDAGDEQGATDLIELMKVHMSDDSLALQELGSFELLAYTINELNGSNQMHYYWQADNLVIWLTVDAVFADGALGEAVLYYQ